MKYTNEIIIDLPRHQVIALFDNADNLKYWQPGFKSFKPIKGNPGEVGAQSLLKYKMGKREFEMVETIVKRNLPDEFHGTYEMPGTLNKVENYFIELDRNRTKWISNSEFNFKGFMKFVAFFMSGSFKKQTLDFMKRFKAFAETGAEEE